MKRHLKFFSLLLPLLVGAVLSGCKKGNYDDAKVKFEILLSESITQVANLKIVSSVLGSTEFENAVVSYSQVYSGSMGEAQSGTFLIVSVYFSLKDNYRTIIRNMSDTELSQFQIGCKCTSVTTVEDENGGEINIKISESYSVYPVEDPVTADKLIEKLEEYSDTSTDSKPFIILNVDKAKSKWSQKLVWNIPGVSNPSGN